MNLNKISSLVAATLAASFLYRRLAPRDSFAGRVIVITGVSQGLGLALARRLAREQARLAIIARDERELGRAGADLLKYCPVVTTWQCDIKDELAVQSTIQNIAKYFGRIDVLINDAREIVAGPLDGMTREDFRNARDIHCWAPLSVTFAVLPHLRKSQVGWYWSQLSMALGCRRSGSEDCHEEVPSRGFRCLRQWLYWVLRRGFLLEFLA